MRVLLSSADILGAGKTIRRFLGLALGSFFDVTHSRRRKDIASISTRFETELGRVKLRLVTQYILCTTTYVVRAHVLELA